MSSSRNEIENEFNRTLLEIFMSPVATPVSLLVETAMKCHWDNDQERFQVQRMLVETYRPEDYEAFIEALKQNGVTVVS